MKRDAGYFTESGVYRGGLWRHASNTESEVYHCLGHTDSHCRRWTIEEENPKKREYGSCTCLETELSYCGQWVCKTTHVDKNADCESRDSDESTECVDLYLDDTLTCACDRAAPNELYCSRWSCREDSSNGYSEDEDYDCLVEDVSGKYCYRWKGNVSSSFEVESSVCECFDRGEHFCEHWECRERALIRCESYLNGWCRIEIGIGVGGGMGLLFLILIGVNFRNPSSEPQDIREWCDNKTKCFITVIGRVAFLCFTGFGLFGFNFVVCCLFIPSGFFVFLFIPINILNCICTRGFLIFIWEPIRETYRGQVFYILLTTVVLVLPWLSGVLIWGGVLACAIVLPIWLCVLSYFLLLRYYQRILKDLQVHPLNE